MFATLVALALVQSGNPTCVPRADLERELKGFTERASGPDVAGNVISWREHENHRWVILLAPRARPDALCVLAAGGGPPQGAPSI